MTKKELIKLLEELPDDTEIYVPSMEVAGDIMPALYVDVCDDGSDGGIAEVNIAGDGEWKKQFLQDLSILMLQ